MKLIIQVPCLNEEHQLPTMLPTLPTAVDGFDEVEVLIIDDGSTDRTVEVARSFGVDHVVSLPKNMGLASAFQFGLDACLKLGADVIVNTDADNQYDSANIPDLVAPVLAGNADVVIGDRNVSSIEEFSRLKIKLQLLGSSVVRMASGTDVTDTTSGFRAYSRGAALRLTVVSRYTYTIESIIQAGKTNLAVESVPVATNPAMRSSRLFGSTWSYVRRNAGTIIRVFAAYEPMRFFGAISGILVTLSVLGFMPFILDWAINGNRSGHLQSIVLGAVFAIAAVQVLVLGVVADLLAANRIVSQRTLERVRQVELALGVEAQYLLAPESDRPTSAEAAQHRLEEASDVG